jgi:hypothetical protein
MGSNFFVFQPSRKIFLEEGEFYYAAVFFAQQATEKMAKAFPATQGITGIKRHVKSSSTAPKNAIPWRQL